MEKNSSGCWAEMMQVLNTNLSLSTSNCTYVMKIYVVCEEAENV
jgi:hypothetical protein